MGKQTSSANTAPRSRACIILCEAQGQAHMHTHTQLEVSMSTRNSNHNYYVAIMLAATKFLDNEQF